MLILVLPDHMHGRPIRVTHLLRPRAVFQQPKEHVSLATGRGRVQRSPVQAVALVHELVPIFLTFLKKEEKIVLVTNSDELKIGKQIDKYSEISILLSSWSSANGL